MAQIKPASQLKPTDVHTVYGAVTWMRRQNGKLIVRFANHATRLYRLVEHITVS